jgi:steroid delta-isomerase
MATGDQIRRACEQYVALLSAHDADGIAALYAEGATIEDPVGNAPLVGRDAILAFYRAAIERANPTVVLTGPVRVLADGSAGAAPLQSRSTREGRPVTLDIIDVFTFDDRGLITSMRAYWGPDNVHDREE